MCLSKALIKVIALKAFFFQCQQNPPDIQKENGFIWGVFLGGVVLNGDVGLSVDVVFKPCDCSKRNIPECCF